ncbi:MAG TPA: hypothetical protein VIL85_14575 [Thermomicrobiales bacterium]|jgi:hypothetical protein
MIEQEPQGEGRHPELDEAGSRSTAPGNAEAIRRRETHVVGEAVLSTDQVGAEQQLAEIIPQGRSRIEEDYGQARAEFERDFLSARATATDGWGRGRIFEEAELNYRAGFIAGNDLRYDNQTFEEIEADLRREYLSSTAADSAASAYEQIDDRWERLREEIRAGFAKARARGEQIDR